MVNDRLQHHGILGQKWGIRRFQNKDGTLTPEGRKRLKIDEYTKDHNEDIILKKGTKVSRAVSTDRYDEMKEYSQNTEYKDVLRNYLKQIKSDESNLSSKYVSVDDVIRKERTRGEDLYTSWFSNEGWDPNNFYMDYYSLKKDVKVASGKKVVDTLLDEIGSVRINDALVKEETLKKITLEYTQDKELFNRVNKRLIDKGYSAIEDINDPDTQMPVIMLNAKQTLGNPTYTKSGEQAVKDLIERLNKQ